MLTIENVAAICHAANRELCLSQGDVSQVRWDKAPNWAKESAISGVEFHVANPKAKPADSHKEWLKHKEADGWTFGEIKDTAKKEHPCMVPYGKLLAEQRLKDCLFTAIVGAARPFIALPDEEPSSES